MPLGRDKIKLMFRGNQGFTLQEKRKSKVPKTIRNTVVSAAIMIVTLLGIGVSYSYYMSQKPLPEVAAAVTEPAPKPKPFMKPSARDPNAPVSASVQSLTTPVVPGTNVGMVVRTSPGATCTIEVKYDQIVAKDSGLTQKVADEYGTVSWTWTVGRGVPPGIWPAKATCALNKKSAVVEAKLEVK